MFKQKPFQSQTGKKYLFQFPGIRTVAKINDRVKNKFGVASDEKIADEMLSHVIVEPKMKIEDFGEDIREFNEVIGAAFKFVNGLGDDDVDDQQGGSQKAGD